MMNILLLEDEPVSARQLQHCIELISTDMKVRKVLTSIEEGLKWLPGNSNNIDLVFSDIRLSDGLSFTLFRQYPITCPVVFVTAHDEYWMDAFKTNGIGYVLKPYEPADIRRTIEKYERLVASRQPLQQFINQFSRQYRQSFLVATRDKWLPVHIDDIAWFQTKNEVTFIFLKSGQQYLFDLSLEQLQDQLDPSMFFRVNRQFLVHRKVIREVQTYFTGRLLVATDPLHSGEEKMIVSKARSPLFKQWMNQ